MAMNETLLIIIILLSLAVLGLLIRFRLFWINPVLGVDQWYWLLCAEDVKRRRKLPPKLPYFMLEIEEQWYPPLFAGLLALLPIRFLEKNGGKISQLIDLLHGLLIFLAVLWTSGSILVAFLSSFSYIIAFFPMSYNFQLQPRGLANLLLTLAMGGLWFYIDTGSFGFWLGVLILSVILLFLHKMTVQMWIVYLLGFGVWAWDWKILLLIPASVLLALVVSKGFYIKMLKAHWDIVSFWNENIHFLGGHQYYESPIYNKGDSKSTYWQRKSFRRLFSRLMFIPYYNIFALLLSPPLIYYAIFHPQEKLANFLWTWLVLTYIWAFSTTLLPYFRALGAGALYIYQSFFPMFLLISLLIPTMPAHFQWWLFTFWGLGILIAMVQWEKHCRSISTNKKAAIGKDLIEVLNYLKQLPKDGVFSIPFQLLDGTAYWTHKKVFWGGHSYGLHTLLKPYFPIMREDVKKTLKNEPINYLLFWRGYLNSLKDIGLEEGEDIRYLIGKGEYELYEVVK
jgi:hypothetical protein